MTTFYDIPSQLKEKAWSPNTFKTRICLNYKGIPYKTEWVEYPDIESTIKKLGGAPTEKKDGRDLYTLPAIRDTATGKVITDSEAIAAYLDAKYPDTPLLIPPGTRAAIAILEDVFSQSLQPIFSIALPESNKILNPPSEAYFRRTREQLFGKRLEEVAPPGPIRDGIWVAVREGLDKLAGYYDKNGKDKLFFLGDTFSFADAFVIGYFVWFQIVLGAESDEWKALASWNNGRWGKLVDSTKKWQVVN